MIQGDSVTTIATRGSDPPGAAGSEFLASLHTAQTEASQAFSLGRSNVPSQGEGAGTPHPAQDHWTGF